MTAWVCLSVRTCYHTEWYGCSLCLDAISMFLAGEEKEFPAMDVAGGYRYFYFYSSAAWLWPMLGRVMTVFSRHCIAVVSAPVEFIRHTTG